jgi:hypothetical protein
VTIEEVSELAILILGGALFLDFNPSAEISGEAGVDPKVSIALSSSSGKVASRPLYLPLLIFQHLLQANAFSPSSTSTEVNALRLSSRPVSVAVPLLEGADGASPLLAARSFARGSTSAAFGGGARIRWIYAI